MFDSQPEGLGVAFFTTGLGLGLIYLGLIYSYLGLISIDLELLWIRRIRRTAFQNGPKNREQ